MNKRYTVREIVLRDLEPLLRETISNHVTVVSFSTQTHLPPGENYGSTILSVHAVIRRSQDREQEDLYLIAKMSPPTDFQKRVFDSPFTFRKEIFMYQTILPAYNRLEMECGIQEEDLFDILPKFYGSRLCLDPTVDFDDNAVILLENLKSRGYYTGNRRTGYDLEHSKLAVRAMARFHALGMALKSRNPEDFKYLKLLAKLQARTQDFNDVPMMILRKIKQHPDVSQYYEKCLATVTDAAVVKAWGSEPEEPWSSIVHADFWVNNIMFHRNESGSIDDVKFVDFQSYLFLSPLRELVFFLFSSVSDEVKPHQLQELIDLYHGTLIEILNRMGCDVGPFSRKNFDARLPIDARHEFMHLCFILKILTIEVKEANFSYSDIDRLMVNYEGNQAYADRLRKMILYFVKHDWI